jgi:hypothetical protein
MTSVTDSFSYEIGEREVVKRAREIASTMGISFSAYVMNSLKNEEKNQKKEEGPLANSGPTHTLAEVNNVIVEYKPALDTSNIFEITKYISHLDEPALLRRILKNSGVMKSVARTRIKKVLNL